MQRWGRWVRGSEPRAALMLSVQPHNQGATFAPQMLGFHGDTGIYQTVISCTRNKTSEHVHVRTWERAWPWEALCTGRKLAHKHQDECTPAPERRRENRRLTRRRQTRENVSVSISNHLTDSEHPVLSTSSLSPTLPVTIETTVARGEACSQTRCGGVIWGCSMYLFSKSKSSNYRHPHLPECSLLNGLCEKRLSLGHMYCTSAQMQRTIVCRCQSNRALVITDYFEKKVALILAWPSTAEGADCGLCLRFCTKHSLLFGFIFGSSQQMKQLSASVSLRECKPVQDV